MNIIMTGGTSGIGKVAAEALLARAGTRLTLGARGQGGPEGALALPLDLASLASVRAFADAVVRALDGGVIDALVLNAGIQRRDIVARSADGHELTFATNHLAHHLLLRRLAPHLATGARVVITTSGTHDPAERTGLPPPRHADAARLADPALDAGTGRRPLAAALHAYTASKLSNLLTARMAAALPDISARGVMITAYDPGLTPGTGLVRAQIWPVRALIWPLLPLIRPFRAGMNSLADAGAALAALAADVTPPPGRVYASLRKGRLTWPEPSRLARDDAAMRQLWQDSVRLAPD